MSDDDSDSRRLVQLGQSLLDQSLDSANENESRDSFSDSVYIHAIQLSALLKSMRILSPDAPKLSEPEIRNIQKKLRLVLDDLARSEKGPSPEIGTGSSIFEAYRVVCFALLVIENNSIGDTGGTAAENRALKEKLKALRASMDSDTAELFEYIQDEFGVSEDSVDDVLGALKQRRSAEKAEFDSKDEELARLKHELEQVQVSSEEIGGDAAAERRVFELMREKQQCEMELAAVKREKEELAATLAENLQITEEFSKRFQEMQKELEERDSNSDANSAQFFVMETDLQAANIRCKELQEEKEMMKEKIKQMSKIMKKFEGVNKAKDAEIEKLKMENEKLAIERDELKTKLDASPETSETEKEIMEREMEKLNLALKEVADQMDSVADELASESKTKTQLFAICQAQSSALSVAETEMKKLQEQLEHQEAETARVSAANAALEKRLGVKCDHKEVVEDMRSYVSQKLEKNDVTAKIMKILQSEESSASVKCIAILDLLVKDLPKQKAAESGGEVVENLKEQNKRLVTYLSNVMHFIDQLANSKDVQSWMIDAGYEDDCRPTLVKQCGRIDSFLKQNQLVVDTQPVCSTFSKFPEYLKEKLREITSDNRELVLIIQIVCCANEVMRKFGDHLVEQINHLTTDMARLRHELQQTNEETEDQIYEATDAISRKLANEQEKNRRSEAILQNITQILQQGEGSKAVRKCLKILEGAGGEDTELNMASQMQQTINERDAVVEENAAMAKKLHKRKEAVKKLGDEVVRMESEIHEMTSELEEKRAANVSLSAQVTELEDENNDLRQTIQAQMEELDKSKESIKCSLESLGTEYEQKLKQLQEEFNNERERYEAEITAMKKEKKLVRREAREQLRKVQGECDLQTQRSDELRNHFEPLLTDLRNKLKDARTAESNAQTELRKSELAAKELKADLAAARIDLKMLQMKLTSCEEKMKREKALLDTQARMQLMGAQTEHQTHLEEQKAKLRAEHHSFLLSVCEKMRQFTDPSAPVTDDSVVAVLDTALESFYQLGERVHKLADCQKEVDSLREVLGVSDTDTSLVPVVTSLSKQAHEYQQTKGQLEEEKKEVSVMLRKADAFTHNEKLLRDWEQWANRVHCLVADSFSSPKSPRALQNALEEIIIGSIGQRHLKRRLEILRIEKNLLKSGLVKSSTITKKTPPTVRALICVAASIHRLQRISGHLKCCLMNPKQRENDLSPLKTKGFPIVNVV